MSARVAITDRETLSIGFIRLILFVYDIIQREFLRGAQSM